MRSRHTDSLTVVFLAPAFVVFGEGQPIDSPLIDDSDPDSSRSEPWTLDTILGNTNSFSHVSIAVDPTTGFIHISYYDSVNLDLMMASKVGVPGNCGEGPVAGDWNCTDVDYSPAYGSSSSSSLDVDGDSDPVIAFYDQAAGFPVVAHYSGSGGNCGTGLAWLCRTVQKNSTDTGKHVSLFVESSGYPHIAYQNVTDLKLEYARYVVSGGNCGYSSSSMQFEWQCDVIDDMDNISSTRAISIATDKFGYPIIAYQAGLDPGPAVIRVARPVAALGGSVAGNCGPGDSWFCEGLYGNPNLVEADSVALGVDDNDGHYVVYSEVDYYPFPAEHNLMFAEQAGDQIFGDGFEDGTMGSWSNPAP